MHNILDFIDSPMVREYNKNRVFTPAEQAILIARSNQPIIKKREAFIELANKYTNEEFRVSELNMPGYHPYHDFRELLLGIVDVWDKSIDIYKTSTSSVYVLHIYEIEDDTIGIYNNWRYFNNYKDIEAYLVKFFRGSKTLYGARVDCIMHEPIDQIKNADSYQYSFGASYNKKLDMVHIEQPRAIAKEFDEKFTDYFPCEFADCMHLYLDVPFKCGDIVKFEDTTEILYGVVQEDYIGQKKIQRQ